MTPALRGLFALLAGSLLGIATQGGSQTMPQALSVALLVPAIILAAAAAGGSTDTGGESGFASLVDLRTGDIVWFNVVTAGSGELRKKEGAASAVATLFKNIPANQQP